MEPNFSENGEIHWSETWKMRSAAMGKHYASFLIRQITIWAAMGATFGGVLLLTTWLFRRREVTIMPDLLLILFEALVFGGLRLLMELLVPREIYVSRGSLRMFYGRFSRKQYVLLSESVATVAGVGASLSRVEFCTGEKSKPCLIVGAARQAEQLATDLHRDMRRAVRTTENG